MHTLARVRSLLFLVATAGCASAVAARTPGTVDASLLPSLQIYTESGEVSFVFQVTNTGETPLELRYPDARTHDFVVLRGRDEVWRWSDGRMFAQAIGRDTLDAGESLRLEGSWTPPAGLRGELVGIGRLAAEGVQVEQSARFTLP